MIVETEDDELEYSYRDAQLLLLELNHKNKALYEYVIQRKSKQA